MTAQGNTGSGPSTILLAAIFAVVGVLIALLLAFSGVLNGSTANATVGPGSPGPSLPPSQVAVISPGPSSDALPTTEASAPPTDGPVPPTFPPTAAPAPTPTANTNPRIVSWEVPKYEDCTGTTAGSIDVSWEVRRATGVTISIDGPGIYNSYGPEDAMAIPFGCSHSVLKHTYTLTTTGGTGPAAQITRTVTARPPSITSFEMGIPDCGPGDTSTGISMSYEIRAATGAELRRDGGIYSTYGSKSSADIVVFDCTKAFQVFVLTTTGGYGEEASKEITVLHN